MDNKLIFFLVTKKYNLVGCKAHDTLSCIRNKAFILGTAQMDNWSILYYNRRIISIRLSQHLLSSRHREKFGMRNRSVWRPCRENRRKKIMIVLKGRNVFLRRRPQRSNSVQNKRQGKSQGSEFNRRNSKSGRSRLRALILILIPACKWKQHALL